jgi:hypothetical protein
MVQIQTKKEKEKRTSQIPITSGTFHLSSLADKIYEEDNEIYSSTQHNEEESIKEPSEKSIENIHLHAINNTQLLVMKKDPSFLETLYNHRAKNDNERVTNARRRLEEKYSSNKWKMNNELVNVTFRKQGFNKTQKLPGEGKILMASSGSNFYQNSMPPTYNSGIKL